MRFFYIFLAIAVLESTLGRAFGQDAATFFNEQCAMCHSIGGGVLVGPDLKNVTERADRKWLEKFILDPEAMFKSADPTALKLRDEAGGMEMPLISGMTPQLAHELVEYLDRQSKGGESGEPAAPERPVTPQDIAAGQHLFSGELRLRAGGPACASCHALSTEAGIEGGRLGPDLTLAAKRLGGRKGLNSWLSAPPTTTMKALFGSRPLTDDERFQISAALDSAANQPPLTGDHFQFEFVGVSVAGTVVGLSLMGLAWRKRFRNVRRKLVTTSRGVR